VEEYLAIRNVSTGALYLLLYGRNRSTKGRRSKAEEQPVRLTGFIRVHKLAG